MANILPENLVIHRSVPTYGTTQLGLRSHLGHYLHWRPLQRPFLSLGLTNRFSPPQRSDPLCLATLLGQWLDLSFLTSGIPVRPFQAEFTVFTDALTQSWGDSQIAGVWTRSEREFHINVLELGAVMLALHHWATVLQGHQVCSLQTIPLL